MEQILAFLRDFGEWGLFIHAMIDAIIFPIPAFFLQVSLSALNPANAIWLATLGFVGCLLGTPVGYGIGKASGSLLLDRIMKRKWLDSAKTLFQKHGEAAILVGAFTPIPFKIFTILSGVMKYPLWKLIVYAFLGRGVKFYAVGMLFYVYGRAAEGMVDRVLSLVLAGVGVLIAAVWLIVRRVRSRRQRREQEAGGSLGATAAERAEAAGEQPEATAERVEASVERSEAAAERAEAAVERAEAAAEPEEAAAKRKPTVGTAKTDESLPQ